MIKIYKDNNIWVAEETGLRLMVTDSRPDEVINKLCDVLRDFLLMSYSKNKLDKILGDQE